MRNGTFLKQSRIYSAMQNGKRMASTCNGVTVCCVCVCVCVCVSVCLCSCDSNLSYRSRQWDLTVQQTIMYVICSRFPVYTMAQKRASVAVSEKKL